LRSLDQSINPMIYLKKRSSEFQSAPSNKVYIGQQDDGSDENLAQRKLEAYFDMPFGKISIGQGDGAANGTSEEDLSGTSVVMYCGVADTGGSLLFRDSNNQEIAKISATRGTFDGLSRNDRVRYDTPKFGMHAIAVEYGMTEDLDQKNDESSNYAVAYVVSPWKGVEFYGTYRLYMLDGDGREMEDDEGNTIVDESGNAILTGDAEDISVVMVGTRVKF
jgi:hypothetical protein